MFSYHRAGPEETKRREKEKEEVEDWLTYLPLKLHHLCKPIFTGLQEIEDR